MVHQVNTQAHRRTQLQQVNQENMLTISRMQGGTREPRQRSTQTNGNVTHNERGRSHSPRRSPHTINMASSDLLPPATTLSATMQPSDGATTTQVDESLL